MTWVCDLFTKDTKSIKEIIDKQDFTEIRNFSSAKDSIMNEKTNHRQDKYVKDISDNELLSKM